MRSSSVNNSTRIVDMHQAPSWTVLNARRNTTLHDSIQSGYNIGRQFQSGNVVKSNYGITDFFNELSNLSARVTAFFNQFSSPILGKPFREVAAINPPPELNSGVLPEPVLKPTSFRNDPAGYIPGLSMKRSGARADDIWGGFRQGPSGNCVTVSAIKAAMHRFGQSPTDIYKEVTKMPGGYRVVMRDDFTLSLADHELKRGARGAKFVGADKGMLKDAQFLYAVSAKRAQMENNDGTAGRSFEAAISSLNDREDESGPGEAFKRLGLSKHMRPVSVRDLARGQVGMCNRSGHSVAVINGREELWGRRAKAPTHGDAIALV